MRFRGAFGVLSRYVARRVAVNFALAFLAVFLLIMSLDMIELLRKSAGNERASFQQVALLAALHAPGVMLKTMPFVMLLSAMAAYIQLSRSSEMTAAKAAGASFWRLGGAGMVAAGLIGALMAGVFSPISAAALGYYDRLSAEIFEGRVNLLSVSKEGLWLRDRVDERQMMLHAAAANNAGTSLSRVSIYEFNLDDSLKRRIIADSAVLDAAAGAWRLRGGVEWSFDQHQATRAPAEIRFDEKAEPTNLTREGIQESFAAPEAISIWRLPGFIANLERSGFAAFRHKVFFHGLLTSPVLFAAMTLIAAAFAIRPARSARFGLIALSCALTGFAFYFINDVSLALGASGAASAVLSAWAPAIGAVLMGAALALKFEEG